MPQYSSKIKLVPDVAGITKNVQKEDRPEPPPRNSRSNSKQSIEQSRTQFLGETCCKKSAHVGEEHKQRTETKAPW